MTRSTSHVETPGRITSRAFRIASPVIRPASFAASLPRGSAIYGNDVSLFEGAVAGKTMDHYIVHAHAERRGKAIETFEGRNCTVVADEGLGHLVQLRSCHTRGDQFTDLGQCTRHQISVDAEQLNLFFGLRPYHIFFR